MKMSHKFLSCPLFTKYGRKTQRKYNSKGTKEGDVIIINRYPITFTGRKAKSECKDDVNMKR